MRTLHVRCLCGWNGIEYIFFSLGSIKYVEWHNRTKKIQKKRVHFSRNLVCRFLYVDRNLHWCDGKSCEWLLIFYHISSSSYNNIHKMSIIIIIIIRLYDLIAFDLHVCHSLCAVFFRRMRRMSNTLSHFFLFKYVLLDFIYGLLMWIAGGNAMTLKFDKIFDGIIEYPTYSEDRIHIIIMYI